jgi:coenzyme F420-reducing hydrogenase gamma subunit
MMDVGAGTECVVFRQTRVATMKQARSQCKCLLAVGKCASVALVDSTTGELLATVYFDKWDLTEAGERAVRTEQSSSS